MEITFEQVTKMQQAIQNITLSTIGVLDIIDSLKLSTRIPPLFKQCDKPWGSKPYSDQSGNTHCFSGCLVSAFASLANWANTSPLKITPFTVGKLLSERGAFVGPYLSHPSRVGYQMKWYKSPYEKFTSPRYGFMQETSKVDYTQRPADVELLANILERHPVVALLDYYPHDNDIDTHFVLVYKYIPDPTGGLNDDALIMDPMGGYTSILTYFNPEWYGQWMIDNNVSKVARTICGLRIWEPSVSV